MDTSPGPSAMYATDRLHSALAELVDTGRRPACLIEPDLWISDSPAKREIAAKRCRGCPVLAECAAAAQEVHARFGVWAARDRTKPPRPTASPRVVR